MSDKVGNVPLFYSVREGGAKSARQELIEGRKMKIRKVIILSGRANSGKTTTLKGLARDVLLGGKVLSDAKGDFIFKGTDYLKRAKKAALNGTKGDITIIVEINGHIIVIVTCGDDAEVAGRVKKLLDRIQINGSIFALIVAVRKSDGELGKLPENYGHIFSVKPIYVFKPRSWDWALVDAKDRKALNDYWVGRVRKAAGI